MDDATGRIDEIEAEIAGTRADMAETIDAIQERLTPGNLAASAGETVRNAATEKVKQMADTAGDVANRAMNTPIMQTIRENPVPAAMIGIGAAWLFLNRRSSGRTSGAYGRGYPSYDTNVRGFRGSYGEYAEESGYSSGASAVGTAGTSRSYGSTGTSGSAVADATSRIGETASDMTDRARDMASHVGDSARDQARRAQVKFNDVMRDNPLVLGAAAALIGAAVGMTVPATETENELMGDARDQVVDKARSLASDAANQVAKAADNVQDMAASVSEQSRKTAGNTSTNRS